MKKGKTLLVLTPGFPIDESDSTCLPAQQEFLKALYNLYPDLTIMVVAFQYPYTRKTYNWNGITVIPFYGRNRGNIYRRILWWQIWKTILQLTRQYHVVGFLSFWLGECALLGKKLSLKTGIKTLVWLLGQDAKKGNKYVRKISPQAGELIAISDFISTNFQMHYGITPKHIIPIGISPDGFPKEAAEGVIDIMGAGSLIPLKQFDVFIDVIQSLVPNHPKLKVILCGDGPEKEKLQSRIVRDNLQKNIQLLGEVPHVEVLKWMKSATVFLHTSSYEGFGGVCLEALHAGAVVVSTVQPMNNIIERFHVISKKADLVPFIDGLLRLNPARKSVSPYLAKDAAKKIMNLFMEA